MSKGSFLHHLLVASIVPSYACASATSSEPTGQESIDTWESTNTMADGVGDELDESSAEHSEETEDASSELDSDADSDSDSDDDDDNDPSDPRFDLGTIPDAGDVETGCNIDFLFVIDNSGSMADEQQNLARSVPKFVDTLAHEIPNLRSHHVGVITTDGNPFNGPLGCNRMGGLVTRSFGASSSNQICGPYADGHNFMTRHDDLNDAFSCAARVGTSGDAAERPFDALQAALSPAMRAPGACNEGFIRDDAILVITLISDEEDDPAEADSNDSAGSKGDPADWYKAVMAAKDDREEYVVSLSLIGIPEPNACTVTHDPGSGGNNDEGGAEIAPRIKSYTEMFGERGSVGDVCAADYDPFFEQAVSVIEFACDGLPEG